ncbi:CYTH and CHAD domain-containing protein [Paenarthrobacter nitroguajacolicus]|uniref:CYTH and CHAD domain-containing protein n=1 Tax=Paenarthrobacter nitroguajacolicus TaxID=211146 RepID=UPI002855F600|nr:CYTH and CHAD domain-containing protein [Paenarthrobacter nitroguajacolicus]MDR6639075.1 CHAD domain-containing protein [Paenarthrobacter nitroguajacolicus]
MAASSNIETERKFDADDSSPLPDLGSIDGVGRVGEPAVHHLEAVYFDTSQLALAARGITLRRRTGGTDAGWHLKLPHSPGNRTEIQAPLGSVDAIPDELLERVLAYTCGRPLAPVATLSTERTSFALYGEGGERLADFVDDQVRAHVVVDGPRESKWREWELELAATDGQESALQEALAGQLADVGAKPSTRVSKLATALGDSWPAPREAARKSSSGKAPAVTPVLEYLDAQMAELLLQDAHVRQDRDDAVHQMRSLIRRIRSVLHSYRKLFDPEAVDGLESELKSLAETLGRYRDTEVLHERLRLALDELPPKLVLGPVQDELDQLMQVRADTALSAIRERLDSPRYYRLLEHLEAFIQAPPVAPKGSRPAGKTTAKLVNKAAQRLGKRHDAAVGSAVGPQRDKAFHEVRKAAKKLRFAAAAVASVHGKRAGKVEDAAHKVQSILGEHQDSAMAREELLKLGSASDVGSVAFTYGVLHALERNAADATEQLYLQSGKKARKLRLKP